MFSPLDSEKRSATALQRVSQCLVKRNKIGVPALTISAASR